MWDIRLGVYLKYQISMTHNTTTIYDCVTNLTTETKHKQRTSVSRNFASYLQKEWYKRGS